MSCKHCHPDVRFSINLENSRSDTWYVLQTLSSWCEIFNQSGKFEIRHMVCLANTVIPMWGFQPENIEIAHCDTHNLADAAILFQFFLNNRKITAQKPVNACMEQYVPRQRLPPIDRLPPINKIPPMNTLPPINTLQPTQKYTTIIITKSF